MLCVMKITNKLSILAAIGTLFTCSTASAVSVTNGSFEAVQISSAFSSTLSDIPGWTHSGDQGDALLWKAGPQCCGGTNTGLAGDGKQFVTLGGGFGTLGAFGYSAWSQTVTGLTAGQSYVVSFDLAAEGETATQQLTLGLTSGSATPSQTFTSTPTNTLFWQNWSAAQYTFVANSTSATIQFSITNQPYDIGLDAVSIAPAGVVTNTPEPDSVFLLLSGLLCIGGAAGRLKSTDRP
jgi:hypothetical protein